MFAFVDYFANVFSPHNFLILCLGTAGGLIMGALPGLSPTMAVALLIPFTFQMDAVGGLILLGAVYTSTVAGGAVSAILLKIPGAPANIATMLDGHEMARNGKAGMALQLSFLSSGVGGVLGVLVLIFFTPLLARWALSFGPSHLFWMAVLGVTVIASMASSSLIKGLTAGCIGLFISSIGYDGVHAVERFVFTSHLQSGVHIIAALVGLFAVPQVLEMFSRSRKATMLAAAGHSFAESFRVLRSKKRAIGIGGLVGIIIGLVPGAGGQIAGLVAYDQTRKLSDNPQNFGKGEPEGVIAAETANNAMVGPSLVPLLTLSIPGSPTAAVLLGGLLIHGIFPGGDLFVKYPEVSWTFINSLLVGQILMVAFGLYLSGLAARVMLLPERFLAAGVMCLAVFGTYSVQHSYSDVLVMAVLGFGMYVLQTYGYAAGPLVLGIVLGKIAEDNYKVGTIIANAGDGMLPYFFSGGLNLSLIAIIVASIASGWYLEVRQRRKQKNTEVQNREKDTTTATAGDKTPSAKTKANVLMANAGDVLITLFAALCCWASFSGDAEVYAFPRLISALMLVFVMCRWSQKFISAKQNAGQSVAPMESLPSSAAIKRLLPGAFVIVLHIALARYLGFYASSFLAFVVLTTYYGSTITPENTSTAPRPIFATLPILATLPKNTIIATAFTATLYALFSILLKVQTPTGFLF